MPVIYKQDKKGEIMFEEAIDNALEELTQKAVIKIQEITPRDKNRLPKDPSRKVTGSLKRSIGYERVGKFKYKAGSKMGAKNTLSGEETNTYGFDLEFGTKYMKPRSFIRKGIGDNLGELQKEFAKNLKKKLKN